MTAQFLRELIDSEIFVGAGYDDANLVAALARFGGDHLAHRTVSDQCQSHSCLLNCVAKLKYMSTASSSSRFEMRSWSVCASRDRKSTRLNSSHGYISYAVFCLKKKITISPR